MTIFFKPAREIRALRTQFVYPASRLGSPPRLPQQVVSLFIAAFGVIWSALREHLRLDGASFVIVAIFAIALVPIIPHATSDAQLLTCCFDDEAPLTMALDGMRVWPYGNPSNFLQSTLYGEPEVPGYWGKLRWGGFWYYGGSYLDLAFLFYWPLSLLGVPAFPAAPIILRTISFVMALAALLITYNFGRRHAGRIAGTIAALFLLTDPYFVMYAANIHPDTTELAFGLLALAVSTRLIDRGELSSVVAIAMLIGLAQATKFGGIWLLPMAAFAVMVGLRRAQPSLALPGLVGQFIARGALMGLVSFFVFAITTPYAFVKPDYFVILRAIYSNIATSTMLPVSFSTWLTSLWGYHGPLTLVPALAGVALLGIQALRGHVRWPMVLAAILGATQLFWFSYMGRSWVVLGYMIGLFAMMGLFIGDLVATCHRGLARFARVPAHALTAFIVLLAVGNRWWGLASIALDYRNIESKTLIRIGKWAEAGNIPRDARVLWDDSVYFDPAKFPNAKMNGHLITYNDVYAERPTYIILASHMYDAPHFAEMRKTQRYTMQNEGRNSLRLYQDLLASDQPGPTNVPGVEYVRSFSGETDRREDCPGRTGEGPYEYWLGAHGPIIAAAIVTRLFGGGAVGAWIGSQLSAQLNLVNVAGWMIEGIRGRVCFTTGQTLRLYRVNQPGSLNGFSQPIASSSEIGFPALAAFDGEPSQWKPAKSQAVDAFVGFDFGRDGDKQFGKVRVDWGRPPPSEVALEFQYADFGGEWQSAGRFPVKVRFSAAGPFSECQLRDGIGAHRLWRMQILQAPPEVEIAVREVRFLEDREEAPNGP
jgi:Dolichyl-phosphate-mannose-protein mannosyltransferase